MVQRRIPLCVVVRVREAGFDHEAIAVPHQGMAHIAELGFLAFALAVEGFLFLLTLLNEVIARNRTITL
jgi:hypothetical protein